jgi:adenylate cyclase
MLRVLIVQTDNQSARALSRLVKNNETDVWEAWEFGQARELINQIKPEVVFFDIHFPGEEWQQFLKWISQNKPEINVIITNKHPDLQREMLAKELGFNTFLRQPFTRRWVENAVKSFSQSTAKTVSEVHGRAAALEPPTMPRVKMPVRVKITLPYLILAVLFALASAYVVSQVVFDSVQDRYFNQLIATSKQSSDWMVREEDRLLSTLRLIANTQGMADALTNNNSEELRNLVLPLAVNAREEAIELLDMNGISQLTLRKTSGGDAGNYETSRGETYFQNVDFVNLVKTGTVDDLGDKFAGFVQPPWGNYFFVDGPIFDDTGKQVGIILVGKSLQTLANEIKNETLATITFYNKQGQSLSSTLFAESDTVSIPTDQVTQLTNDQDITSVSRDLKVNSVDYTELLGIWEARSGRMDLGVLGVSLSQSFLVTTSQVTRVQVFVLSLAAILLIVVIGLVLSNLITRPLIRLVGVSTEVARGNLDVKVDSKGNDEVAVLAHSFNSMIVGLQEGSIYRDLLGRSVSPEVREQLRQTFSSGNLRLEGQEAVATVLVADIRGFTPLAEKSDPATIFNWLNEYFSEVLPIITDNGGVVNKLDGDAVLAFFGILPRILPSEQSAFDACQAANEMIDAIEKLNKKREERGDPPFLTGIGIHTGEVMAGGLGTSDRIHYTIIGDTVNTTQRLEGLTRELFGENGILISEATKLALNGSEYINVEKMGSHAVKGKMEKLKVYRLVSTPGSEKVL